jgi:hypothetical protein
LGRGGKERTLRCEEDESMLHIDTWRQQNETCLRKGRGGGGGLVQSTLYTCMELSQWNPLILLMYDNSKIK